MLAEMGASQWLYWKTLMELSPFIGDQERADLRSAQIALAVWNVEIAKAQGSWDANRKGRRGRRPEFRKLEEFLTSWGDMPERKKKARTAQEQFDGLVDMVQSWGMQPVKR